MTQRNPGVGCGPGLCLLGPCQAQCQGGQASLEGALQKLESLGRGWEERSLSKPLGDSLGKQGAAQFQGLSVHVQPGL